MTKGTQPNDAESLARALARWEGEGGALAPMGGGYSIDESEMRVLARLGAAVLDAWGELPMALRSRVVQRARTLGAKDHAHVKEALAQFLDLHRSEC